MAQRKINELQLVVALCIISTALVSLLFVKTAEASVNCTVSQEKCEFCCRVMEGELWTAKLEESRVVVCSCSYLGVRSEHYRLWRIIDRHGEVDYMDTV